MRFASLTVALFAIVLLMGCKHIEPDSAYDAYAVMPLKLDPDGAAWKLRKAIERPQPPESAFPGIVETECFNIPVKEDSMTKCRQQRNAAITALAAASTELCEIHIKSIFGNEAAWNIGSGSIALLLSSFATIANVATAKTALAAGSTFANAERSLVNETAYKSVTIIPVVTKINEMRDQKGKEIFANSEKSINDYSMYTALLAMIDYHYSCSFMRGLEKALNEGKQSGAAARKAELEQERRALQAEVDSRMLINKSTGQTADPTVEAAKARMAEIDRQLLTLLKNGAPVEPSTKKDPAEEGADAKTAPGSKDAPSKDATGAAKKQEPKDSKDSKDSGNPTTRRAP